MPPISDRRRHERYQAPAMYTPVYVRALGRKDLESEGYAYDISAGGVRFELDEPIQPGETIAIRIELPAGASPVRRAPRTIRAVANVVWLEDADEPGPAKHAAVFSRFENAEDEALITRELQSGRYRLAA